MFLQIRDLYDIYDKSCLKKIDETRKKRYNMEDQWERGSVKRMTNQSVISVFSYAYRPCIPSNPADGGFSVNLLSNNLLLFTVFDAYGQISRELSFALPLEVYQRYLRMVDYARPWLGNVPRKMRFREQSDGEHTFCFCGYEPLHIEDIALLMSACSFRSVRGHYSRLVYSLFEDIASLLFPCGVFLQPCSFNWDGNVIQPLQSTAASPQVHYA